MQDGRIFPYLAATVVAAATLAALLFTEPDYGYALDEATYRWVAQESRDWWAALFKNPLGEATQPIAIQLKCHFLEAFGSRPHQPHSNFNLPASVHALNVGWLLGGWKPNELSRLRFGSELLFTLTLGGITWKLSHRRGVVPAVAAALGVALSPRVFGHAHLAATETALVCFWIWAVLAVADLAEGRGSISAAAIALGLLAATKLTAWPACAAMVLWAVFNAKVRRLAIACWLIVGPAAVVYSLTPNLWHAPIVVMRQYLEQAAANPWKIAAYFGGRTYLEGMPRWSGLAILLATTPLTVLILAPAAVPSIRRDSLTGLLWLNVAVLTAMRIGGLVPAHDGERQFLPVLALLGMLAGLQVARWAEALAVGDDRKRRPGLAMALLGVCLVEPAIESCIYRGHGLSYYNRAVGGLPGAARLGFEVSYWFEAMTYEQWNRFLDPLPAGSRIFLRPDHPGWPDLMRWGVIPSHVALADAPEQADYYLFYAKKAAYWLPAADGKSMVRTDLADVQANGPALRELRFLGVRLASLHPSGR